MGLISMRPIVRRRVLQGLASISAAALLLNGKGACAGVALKDAAPDFTLEDLDGRNHALSNYRGKVVLLNFWASWCPPCRFEMPSIERLYQSKMKQSFMVLGINQGESSENAFASLGLFKPMPTFPILLDSKSQVAKSYSVQGLPSSFLINRDGRIVMRAEGARDFSSTAMFKFIDDLLL
jgi:thiol-disulfide isomerase/thioredoxin